MCIAPPYHTAHHSLWCSFVKHSLEQAQSYLKERPGINETDIDTQVQCMHMTVHVHVTCYVVRCMCIVDLVYL